MLNNNNNINFFQEKNNDNLLLDINCVRTYNSDERVEKSYAPKINQAKPENEL